MAKNGEPKRKKTINPKLKKKDKIPEIKEQFSVLEDKHLRLKAEFENFRRRKEKEIIRYLEYDGLRLVEKLLPIVDDFDRMLHATGKSTENINNASIKEGAEMVFKKFIKFLDDTQVKPFGEPGDLLDADLHDAMMTKTDKKKKDGQILEVFEKGYRYKEKVIRHAKVIVNKK
ncbi:uncharacterized protein METZ01_LOCUS218012 [marine metagenome]|uniref:Protein GrpE n=1 Tax=marine metagenome TaxID=408172 RepID=A0A382FQ24_9ZZZZ